MEDIEFTSRKKRLGLAVFVLAFVSTPFVSKDFVMEMSDRLLHRLVESGVDVGYGWPLFCHVLYVAARIGLERLRDLGIRIHREGKSLSFVTNR